MINIKKFKKNQNESNFSDYDDNFYTHNFSNIRNDNSDFGSFYFTKIGKLVPIISSNFHGKFILF